MERLQKFLATCGVASRRKSEEIIEAGRVRVNGEVVRTVVMIDPEADRVEVDGKIIKKEEKKIYIMLNKPTGIITSSKDQFDRKTVIDIIDIKERVYPVGRLDFDTSGLIILTNDGEVAYRMTHPSHEIDKVYVADVNGVPTLEEMEWFRRGLKIEDYVTSPAEIRILKENGIRSTLEIKIHEGRNRQVRKMCEKIGHPVISLRRVRVGNIYLGDLGEGAFRYLYEEEVNYLKSMK